MDVGKITFEVDSSYLESLKANLAACCAEAERLLGLMASLQESGAMGLGPAGQTEAVEDDGKVTWELWSSNGSSIKLDEVVISRDVYMEHSPDSPEWQRASVSGPTRVSAVIDGTR
ncbi:hypothetical protein PANO111632_02680 [Paracoccus nototheniae]|uniref:Uncharacterized protein n=1 Tax=Paracoccus nototheniae TaxID=2489002 RepID=A0ABW4DV41_9RHOB|nr:hypothetical protein [Paracoccus nototheniae]